MIWAAIPIRAVAGGIRRPGKRVVLLLTIVVLFGVWGAGTVTREIYPAAIFPSFGTVPSDAEMQQMRFRVLAFESSEGRAILTAEEAFVGAFDSFHARMLDSLVRADGADEDLARWARNRAAAELGWECALSLEIVEVVLDGSGPDTTLKRFEFGDCPSDRG